MSRAKEPGWIRIGRYDDVRRRSLWVRLTDKNGKHLSLETIYNEDNLEVQDESIVRVEICTGREGDDGYFSLSADDPTCSFDDLVGVLTDSVYHLKTRLARKEHG